MLDNLDSLDMERSRYEYLRRTGWAALTKRELEVAYLISKGFNNQFISELLCLSVKAVENCVNYIYSKLDITRLKTRYASRALLVAMATSERKPLEREMTPAMLERLESMVSACSESGG